MLASAVLFVLGSAIVPASVVAPQEEAAEVQAAPSQDAGLPALKDAMAAARAAQEAGDLDEARRQAAVALALWEGLAVKTALSAQEELDDLVGSLGMLKVRLAIRERVVDVREEMLPADHPDLLDAKRNVAATCYGLGDLEGARALFEYVHGARERLLASDHPDLLSVKRDLASTLYGLGDLEGARGLFAYVHAARERLLDPEDMDLLTTKLNLAVILKGLGDLEGARALEEHVNMVWERLLSPEHSLLLSAKQNLAVTLGQMGDLEGAQALTEYVHAARERQLPPDDPSLLTAKLNLAVNRFELGDLEGCRALEEYVHGMRERSLPPDHPELLAIKLSLGVTRQQLGDLEGAQVLFEYVLSARERLLPPDHPVLILTKQNLAVTRQGLGDLEGARLLCEQVHAARERLLLPNHPDLLAAKMNLAVVNAELGDHDGARALFEYVHEVWERQLPPDHPVLLSAKENLALSRFELGDLEGARALEEYVHGARGRLLPAGHPDLLRASQNLAETRFRLGDLEGAAVLTRSLLKSVLGRTLKLYEDSPRQARSSASFELQRLSGTVSLMRSLRLESGSSPQVLPFFEVIENLRAVSTSATSIANAISVIPVLAGLQGQLADVRGRLSDHVLSAPNEPSGEGSAESQAAGLETEFKLWTASLLALTEQRDGLERELRAALKEHGLEVTAITAGQVASALEPDAAVLTFYRDRSDSEPDSATPPDSLIAFVVEPEGPVRWVELGSAPELEDLAAGWLGFLGSPVGGLRGVRPTSASTKPVNHGSLLRKKLLDPCFPGGLPSRLHVVLDDFLHLIPLDALPASDGQLLGDVCTIQVEVSLRRLISPAPSSPREGTLLALGGVDFGAEDIEAPPSLPGTTTPPFRDRSGTHGQFQNLLQTRHEVETLGEQYTELVGGEPILLMKEAATKKALVERASEARYLHLATHGWFAPETFKSYRDSLEQQGPLDRAEEALRGFAPETLCGLALAGANHGANSSGRVPGILTAEELATLDLAGCELAVLSACETNVGMRRAGQGIQSLQGALHAAGVRTAVTSLWKVDDAATRRLMELFYGKLWGGQGSGKGAALWQAKKALAAEGYPARDWAGWVLTGEAE
jgi:CHAT domain-containing protein/tetratricopeptide (TPR) repeat protein